MKKIKRDPEKAKSQWILGETSMKEHWPHTWMSRSWTRGVSWSRSWQEGNVETENWETDIGSTQL